MPTTSALPGDLPSLEAVLEPGVADPVAPVVRLGGGRTRETDPVDPAVGLTGVVRRGARVSRGDPLAVVHARDESTARAAAETVRAAIRIGEAPRLGRLVRERVG